jgi:tRNA 2-thiouridine synthesizing protein A
VTIPDPTPDPIPDPAPPPARPGRDPTVLLDCRGQRCPLPVIKLAQRLPQLPVGAVLRVLADDPAAASDIPAWCRLQGQQYAGSPEPGAYEVRRVR